MNIQDELSIAYDAYEGLQVYLQAVQPMQS